MFTFCRWLQFVALLGFIIDSFSLGSEIYDRFHNLFFVFLYLSRFAFLNCCKELELSGIGLSRSFPFDSKLRPSLYYFFYIHAYMDQFYGRCQNLLELSIMHLIFYQSILIKGQRNVDYRGSTSSSQYVVHWKDSNQTTLTLFSFTERIPCALWKVSQNSIPRG